ncbi:unnamed protein product [Ectocarpus sp. CCAP 1310/34]|nr:unnamed protein product [Ectocarpus sp. CCAP 1310/34]
MARLSDSHNVERGVGQRPPPQHHRGWQARERTASGGARSPSRESPASNRDGSAANPRKASSSKSLRPHDIPYATGNSYAAAVNTTAGTTASAEPGKVPGGIDDKGIVLRCVDTGRPGYVCVETTANRVRFFLSDVALLPAVLPRCMYTNQKTKKRKTWSDGAVKCCPKRQRVSLYRWSEALGVTEKLLGEVYLTVPQYEAFITQGEPELEMELYIVSLDGVIQSDDNASGGGAGSATTPAESTAAIGASGGGGTTATTAGKKRKIFKAFKPPARREPTPAPQPDDSWGRLPPGGVSLRGNGDRGGDGRFPSNRGGGKLSPRTTYTGFGHVESLWDEDEEEDDGQDRHEDGAGLADEHRAGWGMGGAAGPGYQNPYDVGNESDVLQQARSEAAVQPPYHRSTGTSAVGSTNTWMWGPPAGEHSLDGPLRPSRSTADFASGSPAQQQQQERGRHDETAVPGHHGEDGPSSYLERLRRGNDDDDDVGRRSASHYPENQRCGRDGAVTAAGGTGGREENTFGRGNAIGGAGSRVSEEVDRETPGDGARMEMRSTQDILSLFGGFGGTPSTQGGHDHGEQERETAESQWRGPTEAPLGSQASGDALMPVGGGIRRAVDMRRTQKEARAAAAAVASGGGVAGAVTGAASARGASNDDAVTGDWACGTCGVRGGSSSASCRVCGAKRQELRSDGVAQGGDDGVRGGIGSQEGRVGWGRGDDFGGGERPQKKALEGRAGDVGDRPVILGIAEGLEAGAPGRWRTSSPDRPAFPQSGAGGGGEGAFGGSVLETPSSCRKIGHRMQMDMGSSSDSDEA